MPPDAKGLLEHEVLSRSFSLWEKVAEGRLRVTQRRIKTLGVGSSLNVPSSVGYRRHLLPEGEGFWRLAAFRRPLDPLEPGADNQTLLPFAAVMGHRWAAVSGHVSLAP
jgi:hypothetical protein